MATLALKRGDTLELSCIVQQQGQPLDITGWQIDCWVRAPDGRLAHRFAVALGDMAAGEYRLRASSAETAAWPVGQLTADIRYATPAGRVMHTCHITVQVLDAVTSPG